MTTTRFYEVPAEDRERLGFMVPYRFETIDMGAGPRDLPPWAWDASINWRWGFSNRPDFMIRCRYDPLDFAHDGSPVWHMFNYEAGPGTVGVRAGVKPRGWIAEKDGVAVCHYHSGTIRMVDFEDTVMNANGRVVWIEKPGDGKPGVPEKRKYQMLATDAQEGYAGRAFTITLAEQTIPIWNKEQNKVVDTLVEAGTKLRLRGPWHGSAPAGYREVSYIYERPGDWKPGGRWHRKWHQRGGYFGLLVRPDIVLDIMATYLPHVEWARVTAHYSGADHVRTEPLHHETGMPKSWLVNPADCDHDFIISPYSSPQREQPSDACRWCNRKRDPDWVYTINGRPVTTPKLPEPIYFDRYPSADGGPTNA